jgi:hypothetical protein
MHPQYSPALLARFWAYVRKADDCWLWTGNLSRGYGRISDGPRTARVEWRAHVIAWELASGILVEPGQFVCHTCDIPGCVRNDEPGVYVIDGTELPRFGHLFLGTVALNNRDAALKLRTPLGDRNGARLHPDRVSRGAAKSLAMQGRAARGAAHGLRKHPERIARGERQGGAKLTASEVVAMRQRFAAGGVSFVQLAADFGISSSHACGVVRGTFWRHLPILSPIPVAPVE